MFSLESVRLQAAVGYLSDDEASDFEGPLQDSGRTRSSTRRANQANQASSQASEAASATRSANSSSSSSVGEGKGRKRKKKGTAGDGSDSDHDEGGNDKSRLRTEPILAGQEEEGLVCSCQKDVMKCIGILPSLPIVGYFQDSDDSLSSLNDDLGHIVLPSVSRNRRGGEGNGEGGGEC